MRRKARRADEVERHVRASGWCVRGVLSAVLALLLVVGKASAQPVPLVIDADVITYDAVARVVTAQGNVRITFRRHQLHADAVRYDLQSEVVSATGRVRWIAEGGQELRGQAIIYHVRTGEGRLEAFEGTVDVARRVHVRGERLEFSPTRYAAQASLVTTCDPQRPLYHVTAQRVEVIPDLQIIAYQASLYLGGRRVVTVPRLVLSLRPGEERALFPGAGINETDGLWAAYDIRLRLAGADGFLHLKYGTRSGAFPMVMLGGRGPTPSAWLRVGRAQTVDDRPAFNLLPYGVAEVGAATTTVPAAATAVQWSAAASAGWYDDERYGVQTSRLDASLSFSSSPWALSAGLTATARGALRLSHYGTGDLRTLGTLGAALEYVVDRHTTVTLGYTLVDVRGRSPLAIDSVDATSTLTLDLARAVPDRYRLAASVSHNAAVPETLYRGSLAVLVTPSLEVTVSATYNARLAAFDEIEYGLRGICDCLDVAVRYRQVRREVLVDIGLTGITERGAPFVPRSPTPIRSAGPALPFADGEPGW